MLPKINHIFRIHTKELRYSQSGAEILSLNVVASSKYKTKQGEQKEDVCWIKATAFGNTAKAINNYFQEKDRIFISGELKQENWTTQSGDKRSQHTIKIDSFDFIEKKGNQNNSYQQPQSQITQNSSQGGYGKLSQQREYSQPNQSQVLKIDIDNDDIPF